MWFLGRDRQEKEKAKEQEKELRSRADWNTEQNTETTGIYDLLTFIWKEQNNLAWRTQRVECFVQFET